MSHKPSQPKNPSPQDQSRRGVLAAGNWIIDHVKMIDTWPAQDTLATITAQSDGNGGCPYNILKDLSRLECGFPLVGVGLIGKDADGERILRDCREHGIDAGGLRQTDAAPTSYTDVMTVTATGRRTFFHQHGANALLGEEHFALDQSRARILYFGYLCLLHRLDALDRGGRTGASRLLEQAGRAGLVTVADLVSNETSDFPAIINPSLPFVDYLFLNEYELARLSGAGDGGGVSKEPARLEARARAVLQRGVKRAVIIHFPEGALCVQRDGPALAQPSVRVPKEMVAGTVGAGDAFGAGFVFGLHEGWDLQRCLELSVCVAAASLRDTTCSAAIEPWETCLALGRKLGFNAGASR
jgi:sugar/nucleoside kinase (ribokinase family)